MDWFDLLAVQGTLQILLQHHSSKASVLQCSVFFIVHWKAIALTRQTVVGKVMSLLFNMLTRLVLTFLPRSKHLLISWLQSPFAVILLLLLLLLSHFTCARLLVTSWTAAYQVPQSMGFSRQEYCSGVPLPSPAVILEPSKIKSFTVSSVLIYFP